MSDDRTKPAIPIPPSSSSHAGFNYEDPVYLRARDEAFARSNGACQFCGQQPALEAHHWAVDYPPAYETKANEARRVIEYGEHNSGSEILTTMTATGEAEVLRWAEAETARRLREESEQPEDVVLLPADRFSDDYAPADAEVPGPKGRKSSVITDLLAGACSGWKQRPDAAEFYEAMRVAAPNARQRAIAGVLINEGTPDQVLLAQLQGAFTWRQLVRSMHQVEHYEPALARYVNLWAGNR